MDVSNVASLMEVFLGLNIASSLFDNFSSLLSKHLIGNIHINSNIEYAENLEDTFKEAENIIEDPDEKGLKSRITEARLGIKLWLNDLEYVSKANIKQIEATKYFDDCSFISALYCFYILIRIAIDPNFTNFDISLIVLLSILIIISFISIISLDGDHRNKVDVYPPVITPGLIFLVIFCFSHQIVSFWFKKNLELVEVDRTSFILLIIFTPLSHIVLYFFGSTAHFVYLKGFSSGYAGPMFKDIKKLKKELLKLKKAKRNA